MKRLDIRAVASENWPDRGVKKRMCRTQGAPVLAFAVENAVWNILRELKLAIYLVGDDSTDSFVVRAKDVAKGFSMTAHQLMTLAKNSPRLSLRRDYAKVVPDVTKVVPPGASMPTANGTWFFTVECLPILISLIRNSQEAARLLEPYDKASRRLGHVAGSNEPVLMSGPFSLKMADYDV